ncbi:MAG: HD-GYP domain-containing protein [Actinobacteria bacterium]|nr:HD-GYP domain-containing protein [Actinomycetota bacterium]
MRVVAGGFPKRLAESLQAPADEEDPLQLLYSIVEVVDRTDSYTSGHSARVADLAAVIARLIDCSAGDIAVIKQAAFLHDIGKIGIPEKVLRKSGPLTREERHMIDLHPIFGASMLARVPEAAALVPLVLHHHEHWDGHGYPGKLAMTDIPVGARVIAIADAYDAMTSYRTYGPAMTSEQGLDELRRWSGKQFEPRLVDTMQEAFSYGLIERKKSVVFPESFGGVLT